MSNSSNFTIESSSNSSPDLNEIKISPNKYLIISKSNCIYCDKSKNLLTLYNIDFDTINCDKFLTSIKNKNKFLDYMTDLIGYEYATMPMIFFDKNFIGGFSELEKSVSLTK